MNHESGVNPKLRKTKNLPNRISDYGVKSEAIRPTALTWCEASMQFSCRQLAKNAIPLWAFLPSGTISYMIRSLAKKGHKYTGGLNKNGVVSNLDIWLVSLTSISVYTKALHRLLATLIYRYTYLLRFLQTSLVKITNLGTVCDYKILQSTRIKQQKQNG